MGPSPDITFIPGGGALNVDAIRALGFAAVPLPEAVGQDELRALATRTGASHLTHWSHEFGSPPSSGVTQTIEEALQEIWTLSFATLLIRFDGADLFVWAPDEHEFFVLFGAPETVADCLNNGPFDYNFSEYAAEPSFSEVRKEALTAIRQQFTVRPTW